MRDEISGGHRRGPRSSTSGGRALGLTLTLALVATAGFATLSQPALGGSPAPVVQETAVVRSVSGSVFYEPPGEPCSRLSKQPTVVPLGTRFDTTTGHVEVVTEDALGQDRTGTFSNGRFLLYQEVDNKATTVADLFDRRLCGRGDKVADQTDNLLFILNGLIDRAKTATGQQSQQARAAAKKKKTNTLVAKGGGGHKTNGKGGSATVKGTEWTTTDYDDGSTMFTCTQGTITVYDRRSGETVDVDAGESYTTAPGAYST